MFSRACQASVLFAALACLAPLASAETFADLRTRFRKEKEKPFAERIQTVREIAEIGTDEALRFLVRVVEDEDEDSSIRSNTIYQLARIPLPAAFEALVRFYRDGDKSRRSSILSAFVSYRKEKLPKDILEGALASTEQGLRSNVIRYLGERDDPRFLPEVGRFLAEFPTGATSLIYPLTRAKAGPEAGRILIRLYDDTRRSDRDQIPKYFTEAEEPVRAVLGEAIRAGRGAQATNAALIAARAGIAEAEDALVTGLAKAKGVDKVILIESLGKVGTATRAGRDALVMALEAKDRDVVAAAVRALRSAPAKEAIPLLIERMFSAEGFLRADIRVTLESITGQQLGNEVDLWARWWKEHGPGFDLESRKPPDAEGLDRALVDLAMEKGAAALSAIRGKDKPWEFASRPVGTTALVVLALHAAGRGAKDPDLKAGVRFLLDQPVPSLIYDLGIEAMALEAVGGKKYRRRIGDCAKRISASQLDAGLWGYPHGKGDNSNTQYAVLGLRSAARVGIRIPGRTWRGVRDHFYENQCEDGGWSYMVQPNARGSASMTAAGVSSLLICLENMKLEEEEAARLRQVIDRGFVALGKIMKLDKDTLYALYGIERAGVLGRRQLMGDNPWYVPGAKRLVEEQGRDGHWRQGYNEAVQTSFAILFLKKATAPIGTK